MNPAVGRLLRRLFTTVASASAVVDSRAVVAPMDAHFRRRDDSTNLERTEEDTAPKLVYGVARRGQPELLAHGSHVSHSSHASHYSGSGGGSSAPSAPIAPVAPPPATIPAPVKPVAQKPVTPPIVQQETPAAAPNALVDEVMRKLVRVRSKWPREVKLTKNTQFNIFDGDKVIGVVGLNAGTKVKLNEIQFRHAIIAVANSRSPVPVSNTDIIESMGGASAILALPDDPSPKAEEKQATKK